MMLNATISKPVLGKPLGLRPCAARQVSCKAEAAKVCPDSHADADRRVLRFGARGHMLAGKVGRDAQQHKCSYVVDVEQ